MSEFTPFEFCQRLCDCAKERGIYEIPQFKFAHRPQCGLGDYILSYKQGEYSVKIVTDKNAKDLFILDVLLTTNDKYECIKYILKQVYHYECYDEEEWNEFRFY